MTSRFLIIMLINGMTLWSTSGQCESALEAGLVKEGRVIAHSFNVAELEVLENLGYERSNGFLINGSNDLFIQEYCLINRDHYPARPVRIERCVIVIETLVGREPDGRPIFQNEDALQIIFNGDRLFDSSDTHCISTLYPKLSVLVVGRWRSRKSPQVGGYAHSLKRAWVIEPAAKKFKEIPAKSVSCEINEDRD
jgi:hypothetical protein